MKINGTPNPEALKAYTNNSVVNINPYRDPAAGTKSPLPSSDKVQISSTVKLFQDIQKAVQDSPDIRADKVKEVEAKIAQDTYKADYEAIADKLLSPNISSRI
jgi:flagellar biosynthesis anti-sigma factor FlgM